MALSRTYLITGANRGLGRGLLEALVKRPNTTIVAGVRDLERESTKGLGSLAKGEGSKVITVLIDSMVDSSARNAVKILKERHNITTIDVVIANAGISKYYGPASETPATELREHFETNTVGPLLLFQATWPLLQASSGPIYVGLSSGIASITDMDQLPVPASAYGSSKAALNYIVRKIHQENPSITAFVLSPGWVQTDMGDFGATAMGMKEAPVTVEQSISGMLAKIDSATREKTSGTFQSFDETNYNW